MHQITWRAPDELVERVRQVAEREGRSVNEYLTRVLDAVTDPASAGSEAQRLRERLARAGLLIEEHSPRMRPNADAVTRAGQVAAQGVSLSDLVSEGRGE